MKKDVFVVMMAVVGKTPGISFDINILDLSGIFKSLDAAIERAESCCDVYEIDKQVQQKNMEIFRMEFRNRYVTCQIDMEITNGIYAGCVLIVKIRKVDISKID